MSSIILTALMYSLMIITGEGLAYAQNPPQDAKSAVPLPETVSRVEVPKQTNTVIVENNLLSIEIVDLTFGELLNSIGARAGFTVEGSSDVLSRKVTTKFHDLDIDSGIIRLFSLVKESNYLINYNADGSISRLKVYNSHGEHAGATGISSASPAKKVIPAVSAARTSGIRRRLQPVKRPVPAAPPQVYQPRPPVPVTQPEQPVQPEPTDQVEQIDQGAGDQPAPE